MRILAINGSPNRVGSTAKLIDKLLQVCHDAGAECERIDLEDYDISYCKDCNECMSGKECVEDDDYIHLKAKMIEADGIVIGSPYYENTPTDDLILLMSRLSHSKVVLKQFKNKSFVGIATSASDNCERIAKYCACLGDPDHERNYRISGILCVTTVNNEGVRDVSVDSEIIERVNKIGIKLVEDIKKRDSSFIFKLKQVISKLIKK